MPDIPINQILCGDWVQIAKELPAGCVHCIITSPPYWRQRDYGTDGQLGLEKTFEEHIDKLVEGFREMRRILRDDGQLFLNYGDKFQDGGNLIGLAWRLALALQKDGWVLRSDVIWAKAVSFNEKYSGSTMPESVNGTRWERCRVKVKAGYGAENPHPSTTGDGLSKCKLENSGGVFAAQAQWTDCPGCPKCEHNDGYVLRRGSWRPTRAHEHVFQFVKQIPYYADMEAVKEDTSGSDTHSKGNKLAPPYDSAGIGHESWHATTSEIVSTRNIRDVWTINPQPYPEAHYATFPEALVEPMIKVSTSRKGVCPECGAQWARVIETNRTFESGSGKSGNMPNGKNGPNMQGGGETLDVRRGPCVSSQTLGWRPTCSCRLRVKPVPAIVYDPFAGSGTVAAVAARMGRNYMGSEISPDYMVQAQERIQEAETGIPKDEAQKGQAALFPIDRSEADK
jgi:DNA modification methylase